MCCLYTALFCQMSLFWKCESYVKPVNFLFELYRKCLVSRIKVLKYVITYNDIWKLLKEKHILNRKIAGDDNVSFTVITVSSKKISSKPRTKIWMHLNHFWIF